MRQNDHSSKEESRGAALKIAQLSAAYGNIEVLKNVNLTVAGGELFALVGPSGSGKSTLLLTVAGFIPIRNGEIFLEGQNISNSPANQRGVGMVFQSYTLFPHMSAFQNIAYSLAVRRQSKDEIRKRVGELIELLQLQGLDDRYPDQLSGGQQQRVALARALAFKPNLLLLDEPLSALDRKLRLELESEIRRVHRVAGTTMLYVTHDQKEAMAISDRIAVLHDGIVQQVGTPQEIYHNPYNFFVADFFGGGNFLRVRVLERRGSSCVVELAEKKIEDVICAGNVSDGCTEGILMVRPESWIVTREPCPQRGEFQATVDEITFEGDAIALRCRLWAGPKIVLRGSTRSLAGLVANDVIYLTVSGREARVFEKRG